MRGLQKNGLRPYQLGSGLGGMAMARPEASVLARFTRVGLTRAGLTRAGLAAAGGLLCTSALPAGAQEFFQGRTVVIIVGIDVGSGYDAYGRLFARHAGRHIPGAPTVIVQNMPGAASVKAADYIYSIAPKDGTQFAIVFPNALVDPLTGDGAKQRYDPTRFEFLGTADSGTRLCFTYQTSKVRNVADARTTKAIMNATARGGPTWDYSMLLNGLAGTKFEIVTGYKAGPDQFLALERGESDGMCGIDVSTVRTLRPDWLGSTKANFLMQMSLEPNAELTALGIPSMWQFIGAADRAVAELVVSQQVFQRPYIAPPGTAPAQLAQLRAAFEAAHRDPELIAEAGRMKLSVNMKTGAEVSALMKRMYASPKDLVDRMTRTIRP